MSCPLYVLKSQCELFKKSAVCGYTYIYILIIDTYQTGIYEELYATEEQVYKFKCVLLKSGLQPQEEA